MSLNSHWDRARAPERKTDYPVCGNPGWCGSPHGLCVNIKGWGLSLEGGHTALSHPEFFIPKALVRNWFHSMQFRNCMLSTCYGWALGKQGSFLRSHSSVGTTDKDIDNCNSMGLERSTETVGN